MQKSAFTLSEVLISLGIIGVVAAITIPMLVKSYQNTVKVSRLKKGYTILANAYSQAIVDNGEPSTWASVYNDKESEYVERYLKPYLNYTKIQRGAYLPYKTFADRKLRFDTNKGCSGCVGEWFRLKDGSCFKFVGTNSRQYFQLFYDIKCQNNNKPVVMGRDIFVFSMSRDYSEYKAKHALVPFVSSWNPLEYYLDNQKDPINTLKNNCKKDNTGGDTNRTCAGLIMYQGWKITDDYPWK